MKRVLMTAIALAFSTGLAFAADPMEAYIGNTLTVTTPNGAIKIWYKADKTYSGEGPQGKMSGTWEVAGDQLCRTQKEPAPQPGQEKRCAKMESHKVGDSWKTTTPNGQEITLSLVKGS
jgi:hypothetical protein